MPTIRKALLVAIALGITPVVGYGQTDITGKLVRVDRLNPTKADVFFQIGTATVGAGIEINSGGINYDFGPSSLTLTSSTTVPSSYPTNFAFNGFGVRDVNGTIPAFTSFFIIGSNVSGFDASKLSFNSDNLFVDQAGTSWNGSSRIELGFTTASTVPEPGTWMLVMAGMVAIGSAASRRNRKHA